MRRGPTIYLRLSLKGDSKRGLAAAPLLWSLQISPFKGKHGPPSGHTMGQRRPTVLAAETDGSAKYGAADGPPFPFRTVDRQTPGGRSRGSVAAKTRAQCRP
jgi:hypothetical protein